MTWIDVKYSPGTQKTPQQTALSAPAFTDTDHVHFPDGRLRNLPAYASVSFSQTYVSITGGLRQIYAHKRTGTNPGSYYFFATNTRLLVVKNSVMYNITPLQTSAAATLGTDPLTTVSGDATLTVAYTAHGLSVGDRIKLSGATNTGGVTAATYINIEHIVATVPDANSFTVEMGTTAGSSATGGGAAVQIFKQIAAGNLTQSLARGFGAGIFGAGVFGAGGVSTATQTYPRIWSIDSFGNDVVMCPGDYSTGDGQKIYVWDGDTTIAPTVLTNAPTDCNWVLVVNNSVVALCGDTIKISELGDATVWSGQLYYTNQVQRVWKLISGYRVGNNAAVLFTPNEVIALQYVGGADIWDVSDVYVNDGIISPNSAALVDTSVMWMGYRGMYVYDGGLVAEKLDNQQNEDWIFANLNTAKNWMCFAMTDAINGQVYFYFPTGSNAEPSDYVIWHPDGHWTLGVMSRTAAQRPGFLDSVFYMGYGDGTTETPYRHFTGGTPSASWYAKTSYSYGSDAQKRIYISGFMPDSYQSGDITLTMYGKEYAQSNENAFAAKTISSTTPNTTTKAAGRVIAMKFSGSGAATLGGWKMDVK